MRARARATEPDEGWLREGRSWWSFQAPTRPATPAPPAGGALDPIDSLVLDQLQRAGIAPNPPAPPRELVRRLYFDLIGLPPDLEEVESFAADPSPAAREELVRTLLARPEFGERWGRHWLDVVRFAQTNGYERDEEKPYAWRYRDYVIRAFNEDRPYDRFLREQIAGDELEDGGEEALIATGFYRIGRWDDEPDDREQAVYDELDDVLRTVSEGMLGLTVGCARCHDHRTDPIEQEDYYSMLSFFGNVQPYDEPRHEPGSPTLTPLGFDATAEEEWRREREARMEKLAGQMSTLLDGSRERLVRKRLSAAAEGLQTGSDTPPPDWSPEQLERIESSSALQPSTEEIVSALSPDERRRYFDLRAAHESLGASFQGSLEWALTVAENGRTALDLPFLVRGQASSPREPVPPRFVRVPVSYTHLTLPTIYSV